MDEPLQHRGVGLAVGKGPGLEVGVQESVVAVVARGGWAAEAAVDFDPGEVLSMELDDQVIRGFVPLGFSVEGDMVRRGSDGSVGGFEARFWVTVELWGLFLWA